MAAEARIICDRPKQMRHNGMTSEPRLQLIQSLQLRNLDDIQTRGARYTGRVHLPKAANDVDYVRSTPSSRGIIAKAGESQLSARVNQQTKPRELWSPRKKEPLLVQFLSPELTPVSSTRKGPKFQNLRVPPDPASTVTGLKFTGRPKVQFDFKNILDEVILEPKRGKRIQWHDDILSAGHGGIAYNGLCQFHPYCFSS
ncbi:unnamed protein product [Amoebophrya sp. A120]|nr:unnamed protein product [Amoebophrya sp. A120]|eukprot:GSA120T00016106001.1